MNEQDRSIEPVPSEPAEGADWNYVPEGKPEEFGVDSSLTANGTPSTKNYSVEKGRVWQRQEAFLGVYREGGKIGKAANAVGLTRWAVDWWNKHDIFRFRERINAAHADYCETVIEEGQCCNRSCGDP